MRTRKIAAGLAALGFLAAAAPAVTVDVSGVWDLTTQTPQGDMTAEATFVQEEEAIKVTMMGPQGIEMKGEGTVKDKDIEWTMLLSGPMGELTLVYKGKLDGETMAGEVQAGDFGSFPWTAKKKK